MNFSDQEKITGEYISANLKRKTLHYYSIKHFLSIIRANYFHS